jgi:hypothetical protein
VYMKQINCTGEQKTNRSLFSLLYVVGFEVFTAVTMKNVVFWDVALCTSCVNRRFGGTYRLRLQDRKIRERGTSVSRWLQTEPPVGNNQPYTYTLFFCRTDVICGLHCSKDYMISFFIMRTMRSESESESELLHDWRQVRLGDKLLETHDQ